MAESAVGADAGPPALYDKFELTENEPQAPQPAKILMPLKPHQRAALAKAIAMESGEIIYNVEQNTLHPYLSLSNIIHIKTNVGILGDIMGYGKTLTALAIIAANPIQNIFVKKEYGQTLLNLHTAYFGTVSEINMPSFINDDRYINTTLVVCPHGPVFIQWIDAIRSQTTLKCLVIESLTSIKRECPKYEESTSASLKTFFEGYDLVLAKNTSYKTLMEYYKPSAITTPHPIGGWARIMVDEAHDTITRIQFMFFKYLWAITGTYDMLLGNCHSRNSISQATNSLFTRERMKFMMIKNNKNFVLQSFTVPAYEQIIYRCAIPAHLAMLQNYVSSAILDRINADDIPAAITLLGGTSETETDLVALVTKDIRRNIKNKEREIQYVNDLEMSDSVRRVRLTALHDELTSLKNKYEGLTSRIRGLEEQTCVICYDNISSPIYLECTHVFCGKCLMNWMRARGSACPQCRTPIKSNKLIAVVPEAAEGGAGTSTGGGEPQALSKEDTIIKIINERPDGKFLVFSSYDNLFYRIMQRFSDLQIVAAELKGTTATMMHIIEKFKNGTIKVILIDSYKFGAGIDLSFATDVILVHDMKDNGYQCIARAQRVGRTEPLKVHYVYYPHEIIAAN